jgi:hypothetical protein
MFSREVEAMRARLPLHAESADPRRLPGALSASNPR